MRVVLPIICAYASCSLAVSLDDLRGTNDAADAPNESASAGDGGVVLSSFTLAPTSVVGGTSSTGTVVLSGPAPSSGASVALSSKSTVVTVPSVVLVGAGQTLATFTATTQVVPATVSVELDAILGASKQSFLDVTDGTQTIFTTQVPALNLSNGNQYELGTRFTAAKAGMIVALRFWKAPGESGSHVGRLWSDTGAQLAVVTFVNETSSGWQEQSLGAAVGITTGTYRVSYNINVAYSKTDSGLAAPLVSGDLTAVSACSSSVGTFPSTIGTASFFADVRFK